MLAREKYEKEKAEKERIRKEQQEKVNGGYSISIPVEYRGIINNQKYLECNMNENGELVYKQLNRVG